MKEAFDLHGVRLREVLEERKYREFIEQWVTAYEYGGNWDRVERPRLDIGIGTVVKTMLDGVLRVPVLGFTTVLIELANLGDKELAGLTGVYVTHRREFSEKAVWRKIHCYRAGYLHEFTLLGIHPAICVAEIRREPEGDSANKLRGYLAFVWESIELSERRGKWENIRNQILAWVPPIILRAKVDGAVVRLSWRENLKVAEVRHRFSIWRQEHRGWWQWTEWTEPERLDFVDGHVREFVDTQVTPGRTYRYFVRALATFECLVRENYLASSLLSNEVEVSIGPDQPPRDGNWGLLWSYDTGKGVSSVALSSDGSYIVAGSGREVILLNREGELLWSFQTTFPVRDVSISADANYIVVGTLQRRLAGWLYILNREGELLGDLETTGISSVSISPCGNYWAITYDHGLGWLDRIILYCRAERRWLWHRTVGLSGTGAVSISADAQYIAVSSGASAGWEKECEIRLYNKRGELLWRHEIPGRFLGRAHSVSISADGRYIVAGDERGDEALLLNHKGQVLWSYKTGIVEGVSISGDGSHIIAGSRDGIYFFNRDGQILWNQPINDLEDVSFSQDGSYIGAGSGSKVHLFGRK